MVEGVVTSVVLWIVGISILFFLPIFMIVFQIYLESRKPKYQQRNTHGQTLLFRDVSLTVPTTGKDRLLLDNVSGLVHPGEVCAIMGQSGAGYDFFIYNWKIEVR